MRENAVFHNEIEQRTPEWFKIRDLKFTASNADAIASNGKGLETYVKELLANHFSSGKDEVRTGYFKNPAMEKGNEDEPLARMVYEMETGNTVREIGCVTVGDYILASPDGLVTENEKEEGLVEIKNHSDKVFLELILTGKVDPKYVKQMQYQLWVTGYKWCDYFGFNPNFSPSYYTERFYPDELMFKKFEDGVSSGIEMIKNGLEILEGKLEVQEKFIKNTETEQVSVQVEQKSDQVTNQVTNQVEESLDFPF